MRLATALIAASFVPLLTGCPSFATLKTARALDPGQLEVTEATEVLAMAAPAGKGGGVRPGVIVAGRYGVARGLDVGFRVEPVAGFTGESTIQIVRSDAIDLALGPSAGYFQAPGPIGYAPRTIEEMSTSPLYSVWTTSLPVLFGVNLRGGHQIVLAPRVHAWMVQPSPATAATPSAPGGVEIFAGLSAGISIKTGSTLRVMPEIDVTAPIAWTGRSGDGCVAAACPAMSEKALVVQGGLAFTVGPDSHAP